MINNLKYSQPEFYINGTQIKASDVGIKDSCLTLSLEYILIEFDKVKVCHGVQPNKNMSSFGPQFVESNGHWKHSNCLNIVTAGTRYNNIIHSIKLLLLKHNY